MQEGARGEGRSSNGAEGVRSSSLSSDGEQRRRRRRLSSDPYPTSPLVPTPFGSSRSASLAYTHPQISRPEPLSYSSPPTLQPYPLLQTQNRLSAIPLPLPPSPPPSSSFHPFSSSAEGSSYCLVAVPFNSNNPPLLQYPPSSIDTQTFYPQSNASPSLRSSRYPQDPHHHLGQLQGTNHRETLSQDRPSSRREGRAPSSYASDAGGGPGILTPDQSVWGGEEDQWSQMGYSG